MTDAQPFALLILSIAAVGLVVVMSNRLTDKLKVPSPWLVLAGAAIAANVVPALHAPATRDVERIVTVALVCVLFDGGMHIGRARFVSALAPIASAGVAGTFLTAAAAAVVCHVGFGFGWYASLLVATAVAPTDPAVVFSVLGQREVSGRAGTILEGESGANDPVGIALMASLVASGGLSWTAAVHVAGTFALQMVVGALIGVVGGRLLLSFMRRVPLPGEGLYPLRTLACSLILFAVATLAHGSGFLAVFVAGIALGDESAPFKREIERFHSALASLGEIVAFVVLGLTVDLGQLARANVWVPGSILGLLLAVVIRPLFVGVCLAPARLERAQRRFVLFAGLKGAVPILLGGYLLQAHLPNATRLYSIIVIVVTFSVLLQGSLVPAVARLLRIPMRRIDPEPWAVGVRLKDEPSGVVRLAVARRSRADGVTVSELSTNLAGAWITLLVRAGRLIPVHGDTRLEEGDDLTLLTDAANAEALVQLFESEP